MQDDAAFVAWWCDFGCGVEWKVEEVVCGESVGGGFVAGPLGQPGARLWAHTCNPQLVMYDIDTHKTLNSSKLPAIVSAITLHERNDSLIMVTMKTKGKNMGIYDTRKNKVVLEFGHPEPGQQATNGHYRSALSPSGELAVSGTTYVAKSDSKVENYVWDLRWTGMKRNKPAVTIESQHKSAMQRFLWWSDRSYFSTSTGYGCEYVTMK